jgi:Zn finger protein HypA/HybF involved in hydrogenase expression
VHEMSLAMSICRIAQERAGPDASAQLVTVAIEVGDRAGVEAGSLEFCLEVLLAAPPFGRARPAITRVPGHDLRVTYLEVDDGRPPD